MKKRLVKLKKKLDAEQIKDRFNYDKQNRLIIDMEIHNDDYFLDEFSKDEYPIINSDIDEYIQKYITSVKVDEQFTLRIHSNCIDENEKNIYINAIKHYYIDKYLANQDNLKHNRFIALLLGLIGALVLTLVIILEYTQKSEFWMRILDIVSWVFLWEAVDILAFRCKKIKLEQIRNLNLLDMNIEFLSNDEKK